MKKRVVKFNCDPGFFFYLLKEEILHFVDPVFYHPPSFHYFYLPFRPYLHPYHRPFCPRPLCPHHHSFLLYYRPILCNGGVKKVEWMRIQKIISCNEIWNAQIGTNHIHVTVSKQK